ncbi:transmembrane protein 59 isoform X1 [Nematostella vectensis]|uniref:transmembrane protein 59 isoform X1 n=1 Tax=Nematostella vectensis TaxID=45351 RepID=UPI0020778A70|nr:transmembrane protein 59 isoform X1 [Nematostella vectensis]
MAKAKKEFIIVATQLLFLASFCLGREFQSVTEECKKRCERTFPLHTYPKAEPTKACLRGCRLSAISQLSTDKNRSIGNASLTCIKGCSESYTDKDSKYACQVGCQDQPLIPTAETMYKDHMSMGIWSLRDYSNAHPIMVAHQYCNGIMRHLTYYMATSTSYFFGNRHGQAIVVRIQEPPQVFASISEANLAPRDEPEVRLGKREKGHSGYHWKVLHKGKMWLHCVSRRSGLPFWLVASTLFLSIFFMMWLCCATILTTPPHREKEKTLLVDDVMFMQSDDLEKQPLMKEDEAGPLPMKISIAATTI